MKVLLIGGSAFVGRALVRSAIKNGHTVTLFNRGLTDASKSDAFRVVIGDRFSDLSRLGDERWDVVIDTCAYEERAVEVSCQFFENKADMYVLVSTLSVYRSFSAANISESEPVYEPASSNQESMEFAAYGGAKSACERVASRYFAQALLVPRLGFVVGPYDYFPRFIYWLRRIAAGGRILAPGSPERPIQLIDVRDIAHFIIQCIEVRQTGTFNVAAPQGMTIGSMFDECCILSTQRPDFVWVDDAFLIAHGRNFDNLPFWVPQNIAPGLFRLSVTKAERIGLKTRPFRDTVLDTFDWLESGMYGVNAFARVAIAGLASTTQIDTERELLQLYYLKNGGRG